MTPADAPGEAAGVRPSVFLSYASEDRHAARLIREALPAYGLEVWYDESALDGGDAWDRKIRRQIRECDYFMPVISAQTQARGEGYFRREWRLAAERTLDMADDRTFILPVVIDDTTQGGARVPDEFLTVQWLRLPGGQPTPAFEALCRRLLSRHDRADPPPPARKAAQRPAGPAHRPPRRGYPEVPREEPGQKLRFIVQLIGWALQSAWVFFRGLPRWGRIVVYVWIGALLLSRGCASSDEHDRNATAGTVRPLLAIPFGAPAGDRAAQKLAAAAFSKVYGRLVLSHPSQVDLNALPLSAADANAALERGRAHHSRYVLFGSVDEAAMRQSLNVRMVSVADGSVVWSESFPATSADPAGIAAEVDSKVPSLKDADN